MSPVFSAMPSGGWCAQEPGLPFISAMRGYGDTKRQAARDLLRILKVVRP
ncbi:hypothetical protein [Sphingomonas sp. MA1305]|nr:hypothetical protein [Sphingomonas sp. MA1305]